MLPIKFGSLKKGLFSQFSRDNALDEIMRNKQGDGIKKTIGMLKNSPEYKAKKEIRQNEIELEDKLGFFAKRFVKGNNTIGPGLAEMKYIREHAGEGGYLPESLPAYDFQTTQRLLNAIIPGWSTASINQNNSTTNRIKDLTLGLALSNTPYSIPILSRAIGDGNSHGKRSIWRYIIGGLSIIGGVLGAVALLDLDGDRVNGWGEWFKYRTGLLGPFTKNPALKYAVEHGIKDPRLMSYILPLESNGLDANEKSLIDAVARIKSGLIPADIRDNYYTAEELTAMQESLLKSVLTPDYKVSDTEIDVLKKIEEWPKWWEARDIIKSEMISDKHLPENSDGDKGSDGSPLSNYEEIMQGTNPLNDLETNPNNPSERYAVVTDPTGINVRRARKIQEILVKNGYDNEYIYLTLNPGKGEVEPDSSTDREAKLYPTVTGDHNIDNFPVEIDHKGTSVERATAEYFLNDIRNLPSDGNDEVLVYSDSHGDKDGLSIGGTVFYSELNEALNEMTYGRALIVVNCSKAGGFMKNLLYTNRPANMLGISTQSETEAHNVPFMVFLLMGLDSGLGIEEAFNYANKNCPWCVGDHPIIYYPETNIRFNNPLAYKKLE